VVAVSIVRVRAASLSRLPRIRCTGREVLISSTRQRVGVEVDVPASLRGDSNAAMKMRVQVCDNRSVVPYGYSSHMKLSKARHQATEHNRRERVNARNLD
jgi:hypothetical protein